VADQQLKVVDPDPAWADRFAEQQVVVEDLLRPWLTGPAEDPCGSYRLWLLRLRPEARTHHLRVVEGGR
jgi:hypothetical protein